MSEVKENMPGLCCGWIPDIPDFRDRMIYGKEPFEQFLAMQPAESVDLREYFPMADQQPGLPASAAFACGSLVEYYLRRYQGDVTNISKWFLHHVAGRYEGKTTQPVSLRSTLKALVRTGVPPAKHEMVIPGIRIGEITEPILYTYAKEFQGIEYYRLDVIGKQSIVQTVCRLLTAGIPILFGLAVPSSVTQDARIDYRPQYDKAIGGTAGVLVGYDHHFRMSSRGALLFRSCWGEEWGDGGNGWISYRLLEAGMLRDLWVLSKREWSDSFQGTQPGKNTNHFPKTSQRIPCPEPSPRKRTRF